MSILKDQFEDMIKAFYESPISADQRLQLRAAFFFGAAVTWRALNDEVSSEVLDAELDEYLQEQMGLLLELMKGQERVH